MEGMEFEWLECSGMQLFGYVHSLKVVCYLNEQWRAGMQLDTMRIKGVHVRVNEDKICFFNDFQRDHSKEWADSLFEACDGILSSCYALPLSCLFH